MSALHIVAGLAGYMLCGAIFGGMWDSAFECRRGDIAPTIAGLFWPVSIPLVVGGYLIFLVAALGQKCGRKIARALD